jgi:hypothetical protein
MPLTTPQEGGYVPDIEQDQISKAWSGIYDDTYQVLTLEGFGPNLNEPAVPFPDITPKDYAYLEGDQYTQLMATVDYWFGRAKDRLGWVEAELICREGEYKDLVRELKHTLREAAKKVAPRKADLPSETELKEISERQEQPRMLAQRIAALKAQKVILDSRIESLERFAAGLSRRITLRGQEVDLTGRAQPRRHPGHFGGQQ